MKVGFLGLIVITASLLMLALVPVPASGQSAAPKAPPYNPPRTEDGQPNLEGVWQPRT